ncbi:MAG: ATP-binding protein [Chitinophagaceae bacterium]
MNVDFLLIFFIARYLRISLKTQEINTPWDERLKWIMYLSIAFLVAGFFLIKSDAASDTVSGLLLAGFTYILYSQKIFKSARQILIAIAPYVIISLFTLLVRFIVPATYKEWANTLDNISTFAIFWGVGVWFLTIRQRKELAKANEQVAEKEKDNLVITQMKAALEVQVKERTAELTQQKEELELALVELKATQSQLIQSEKMASLGELTAGIAHEIQNPLNFVNNFSEVNAELIEELKTEKSKPNNERDENLENEILNDIAANEEKINHHGKRADAIVKGMLLHSRKNTGLKEPTDINALCDEYIRLSYHGLRAKDKSFNADFKMEFDESIGKINIVPQDMGRVLLNLFNNAFYAVNEKLKAKKTILQTTGSLYAPLVSVSTKKLQDKIEIKVSDNGNGIPQNILDKIFQPFFTTKPTGQGTGLGLSLSYDIVKAHGGEINVETKDGEGTTIIVII